MHKTQHICIQDISLFVVLLHMLFLNIICLILSMFSSNDNNYSTIREIRGLLNHFLSWYSSARKTRCTFKNAPIA